MYTCVKLVYQKHEITQLIKEWNDKTSQTAINVQTNIVLLGKLGQFWNIIKHSMWIAASRAGNLVKIKMKNYNQ